MTDWQTGPSDMAPKKIGHVKPTPHTLVYVDKGGDVIESARLKGNKTATKKVIGRVKREPSSFVWVTRDGDVMERTRQK